MKMPERKLTFSIAGNKYDVEFPKNGTLLEMQTLKHSLSNGQYGNLVASGTDADFRTRITIDMIAFFTCCVPAVKIDLAVKNFSELDALTTKKLVAVYIKTILKWLTEWENFLNSDEEEEVKK